MNAADWHRVSAVEATQRLDVDPEKGLSSEEAAERLEQCGSNRLKETPPRSRWLLLLDQFKGLLILVLIGAAGLAAAIGDIGDAVTRVAYDGRHG